MSFALLNLDPQIFKALSACGYTQPTPIQARSIPEIMEGKDLVASAQTGTGKTAAFVLPALHRLSLASGKIVKPRILILTPTRELASQITLAAGKYGKFLRFKIISLVGGMPYRQQLRELSQPVDIIVATPGRLLDHMDNGRLDLSQIEMLILDEADRMLDMGFIDDVKAIAAATPENRQTLLFSATVDDQLGHIVRQLLKKPVRIDMAESEKSAPKLIKQEAYIVDNNQHKERVLQHLLANENIFKAIIFSGTKINADYLAKRLQDQDFEAAPLHGDLKQNVRNRTIEKLRRGKIQFLVATDVAARGIDINDVTHVINYDLPKFPEDYVHRIGRTGRAGKTGIAISLVLPMDAKHLEKIERFTKQKLEFSVIPGLEPTKRLNKKASGSSDGDGKRRFGGKTFGGGGSKGGYGKSYGKKDGGSEARSGFAARKGFKNDDAKSGFGGRKSYARNDDSRGSYVKRDADARSEYAPRSPRSSEPRTSYARKDSDSRSEYAPRKPAFAKRDGETRGEYTPRPKSSESRGGYARKDSDSRSEYAPRKSSFAKQRDGEGRSAYTPRPRSGESKSYVRKDTDSRSEGAPRRTFRSDDSKPVYEKRDGDPRIQYVRKSPKSNEPSKGRFAGKKDGAVKSESPGRRGRNSNDKRGSFAKNDGGKSFSKGGKSKTFKKENNRNV